MPDIVAKCQTCQKDFLIIEVEQKFYQKKSLPNPTSCPECRQKERLMMRNERKLYKRKCAKCGKDMISTYAAESPYIVYCQECYWQYLG
ncbi:MAG: zinc-ribbon domain containing protein [Candidatus Gracilibacteria bacterium]|jgi:Zn ribbon nucleic-acid-binding protein